MVVCVNVAHFLKSRFCFGFVCFWPNMLYNLREIQKHEHFRTVLQTLLFRWRETRRPVWTHRWRHWGTAVTWGTADGGSRGSCLAIYTSCSLLERYCLTFLLSQYFFSAPGYFLSVQTKAKNRRKCDLVKETPWRTSVYSTKSQGLCFIENSRLGRTLGSTSSNSLIL